MYLNSLPFAKFLELFPCPWHVGDHYGNVPFVGVVVLWVVVVGVVVFVRLTWNDELVVPLVESQIWKLALL